MGHTSTSVASLSARLLLLTFVAAGCDDVPPAPNVDASTDQMRADRSTDTPVVSCTGPEQCASRNCQQGRCVDTPPSCSDSVRNGLESDVDCGGLVCDPCPIGGACNGPSDCATSVCLEGGCAAAPPTCNDGEQNAAESDVDCGQVCPQKCADGMRCLVDEDCQSQSCAPGGTCAAATCSDGKRNGDETDVDCGGDCPEKCADGLRCDTDADCQSGDCSEQRWCVASACDDGKQGGSETDVDCGGDCPDKCEDGQGCLVGTDCESGVCGSTGTCSAPGCADGVNNGDESDVDCGGACPNPCADGQSCQDGTDCQSAVCGPAGTCVAPSCTDGVKNGGESDVDCGQACPVKCTDGKSCDDGQDCQSGSCINGACAQAPTTCSDGVQNGGESDIDCGQVCPVKCADGKGCQSGADCQSSVCGSTGTCSAASCSDGVQNGSETDIDCGGACPDNCADGQGCQSGADCQSGVCGSNLLCLAASCSDGVQNGSETDVDCGGSCADDCADGQGCQGGSDCQSGCCNNATCGACAQVLVEAESFSSLGGWKVDSQFVELMGSAYLLAHGLGSPVADAATQVQFPHTGPYRLWVRTKDWVHPHQVGTFRVAVGGQTLAAVFGTRNGWGWQDGGTVTISQLSTAVALKDSTGFDGRCDALLFSQDPSFVPPDSGPALLSWRREQLGIPDPPPSAGTFDLVVVGGGIAGASATLAAARRGLSVALIHDRAVIGGNASGEVRVHTCGYLGEGFARQVVDDLDWNNDCKDEPAGSDNAVSYDAQRAQVLAAEPTAQLFLQHRAIHAEVSGAKITSVDAVDTRTGELFRFGAPLFIDATGDGWIGYWAGASFRQGREAQSEFGESLAPAQADQDTLGTSVLWKSVDTGSPTTFADVSAWTADVVKDFHAASGNWTWEYGIVSSLSTIDQAEQIRDHLLRAAYGAFYNEWANHGGSTRELSWVAYVAGKRESRRLVGDYLLREQDIRQRVAHPDTIVVGSWPIDLHFVNPCWFCCPSCPGGCVPACSCAACTASCELDFISRCEQTEVFKYGVPFRSLYSKNIDNLMMAGRDISVTHVALGGTRVQNTNGQMGAAVGVAASLCKKYSTNPRGIYQSHLTELLTETTGLDRPLGPLLRNGYVQSDGAKSWSQTCEYSGAGVQDCSVDPFSTWSLPPAAITPDGGTHISDRYAFVYRVGGQRKLRNGYVQSNGAKSWSQTCDIDAAGQTSNCSGFSTWGAPAAIAVDAGQSLPARYAFTYWAGSVQRLVNGFVQSDGKKSWSQTCDIDPGTGAFACGAFELQTLPPAGATPDAGAFISDRYAFVYRVNGQQKLRNGFMQSDGKKSWSQTCDISAAGVIDCSLGSHPMSQWSQPPSGLAPDGGTSANRRYMFVLDPYP